MEVRNPGITDNYPEGTAVIISLITWKSRDSCCFHTHLKTAWERTAIYSGQDYVAENVLGI